jgi:hypothetical protein
MLYLGRHNLGRIFLGQLRLGLGSDLFDDLLEVLLLIVQALGHGWQEEIMLASNQHEVIPNRRHACSASARRLLGTLGCFLLTKLVNHLLRNLLAGDRLVMQVLLGGRHNG